MDARTRKYQTAIIAHKLTSRLPKLPAEFAVILARLAPDQICQLNSRLDSLEIDETADARMADEAPQLTQDEPEGAEGILDGI